MSGKSCFVCIQYSASLTSRDLTLTRDQPNAHAAEYAWAIRRLGEGVAPGWLVQRGQDTATTNQPRERRADIKFGKGVGANCGIRMVRGRVAVAVA